MIAMKKTMMLLTAAGILLPRQGERPAPTNEEREVGTAPAQPERLAAALEGVARVLVVEQNHGAQLYRYLRSMYDMPGKVTSFHRPGPLPLRPGELTEKILEWAGMTAARREEELT